MKVVSLSLSRHELGESLRHVARLEGVEIARLPSGHGWVTYVTQRKELPPFALLNGFVELFERRQCRLQRGHLDALIECVRVPAHDHARLELFRVNVKIRPD